MGHKILITYPIGYYKTHFQIMTKQERQKKLETLAKVLAKTWFYGGWRADTINEKVLQTLMEDLGYYPFKDESDLIHYTQIDDQIYKDTIDVLTEKKKK